MQYISILVKLKKQIAMNYSLIKDTVQLIEKFDAEIQYSSKYKNDIQGFKNWISKEFKEEIPSQEPEWEGKEKGRSPESVINTMLVHMNRYAKSYSKSAIYNSEFVTQEDFIYLINLKAFGAMGKMELIKKNIQEKPTGMLIIKRLLQQGWIEQKDSESDKRSKILKITEKGLNALEHQMKKIRQATQIVTGDLSYSEKMELIRLLTKLDDFHNPIYCKNLDPAHLLENLKENYPSNLN